MIVVVETTSQVLNAADTRTVVIDPRLRGIPGATSGGGGGGAVDSVNGQTGVVVLTASDVGADATGAAAAAQAASQPVDSDLTAIAALATTSYGRAFLALTNAAAARTALALGTLATQSGTFSGTSSGTNTGDQDLAGLQPLDSDLTAIAALSTTTYGRSLLTQADAAAARTTLGLGTLATQSGTFSGTSSGTNTGDQTITLTGDVTGSGTGSFAATLASTITAGGPTGSATVVPVITYDAKGRLTTVTTTSIAIPESAVTNLTTDLAAKEPILVPTAVKTSNYTAAVGDLVKCDSSGGGFTVTLPTAPADKSRIEVKQVAATAATVTVACGGSDVFNRTGGATSATLPLLAQSQTYQYQATGAIWLVTENSTPLSQLDLRFAPITGIPESSVTNLTTDLAAKAPLASPTFTGTPLAPTAAQGTNTTQLATTAMVQSEVTLLAPKASPTFTGTVTAVDVDITAATTVAANPGALVTVGTGTTTFNNAGGILLGLTVAATAVLSGGAGAGHTAYNAAATIKNANGVANSLGSIFAGTVFNDATTYQADGATITAGGAGTVSFFSAPTFLVTNSGVMTVSAHAAFRTGGNVSTGTTVTTLTHLLIADPTVTGTLTTQVGVEVPALANAGTNIGFRNASTTVFSPLTKAITATSDTIPATATHIRLNNTSGSSKTLASAPTIADGQSGQVLVITNTSAQDVVIQDQGTLASSNLRLVATSRTLSTRDSIILKYDATIGDWVELAFSNVL